MVIDRVSTARKQAHARAREQASLLQVLEHSTRLRATVSSSARDDFDDIYCAQGGLFAAGLLGFLVGKKEGELGLLCVRVGAHIVFQQGGGLPGVQPDLEPNGRPELLVIHPARRLQVPF